MLERVLQLKERYTKATTEAEKVAIDKEMQILQEEDADAWAMAMVEAARGTADEAEALVKRERIREQLEGVLPILPLSYIAEHYFKKSRQWLYQRVNGNIVNGKPAQFSNEELDILNLAIQDVSKRLGSVRVA